MSRDILHSFTPTTHATLTCVFGGFSDKIIRLRLTHTTKTIHLSLQEEDFNVYVSSSAKSTEKVEFI